MKTAINIGNSQDKGSVEAIAEALLKLMECRADQKTIQAAIKVFGTMAQIENVSINNSHIAGDQYDFHCNIDDDDMTRIMERAVKSAAGFGSNDDEDRP